MNNKSFENIFFFRWESFKMKFQILKSPVGTASDRHPLNSLTSGRRQFRQHLTLVKKAKYLVNFLIHERAPKPENADKAMQFSELPVTVHPWSRGLPPKKLTLCHILSMVESFDLGIHWRDFLQGSSTLRIRFGLCLDISFCVASSLHWRG